jgi:MFS family permease
VRDGERDLRDDEAGRLGPQPPVPSGWRRRLKLAAIDIGPLRRHREFRLLFIGQGVSFFGSMFTYVALPYQAYQLTGSSLVVGLLALAELVPLFAMALLGGALSDWRDRRLMVRFAELGFMGGTGVLLVNSLLDEPQLWVLFAVAPAMAAFDGIQRPSLDALIPRLVERDEIPAASALDAFRGDIGMVAGPAVAGILIAAFGLPVAYAVDFVTFGVSLVALTLMRAVPPPPGAQPPSVRRVLEGFRYAKSRPELVGTYAVDMVAMFFGMPMALFPAFAEDLGGPGVLGLLYAAPSVGSFAVTLTSGWVSHVHRHGAAVVIAAMFWGLGIIAFGLAPGLALALAGLVVAGAADMVSGIFRMTIWNQTIPDHLRGRLAGIEQISYSSGPMLGNLEAGVVGSLAGIRASAVSGGILCVVGVAVTAFFLPAFWRYDSRRQDESR